MTSAKAGGERAVSTDVAPWREAARRKRGEASAGVDEECSHERVSYSMWHNRD